MERKTPKTLEVGDLITDGVGYMKILAVLHRGNEIEESVYILSVLCESKESEGAKKAHGTYTSFELEFGYKIVGDEPEELTMEEVCNELGRVIKIKK